MRTEQNEFLLAEIDWLEEELEKTLNTPIQDDNLIAENESLRGQISRLGIINDNLKQNFNSLSASELTLSNRLKIAMGYTDSLEAANKRVTDINLKLTRQIEKTKWYHLLFNIKP